MKKTEGDSNALGAGLQCFRFLSKNSG